ncbi:MAG: DegT/DnrJ/EryC1/StrS family aminotransferase [Planctomycetota bacterium]
MAKKAARSDFRYATGPSKVPWRAVGESVTVDDVMDIIKFLIPPEKPAYKSQLAKVANELKKLSAVGSYATKLSLSSKVAELEKKTQALLKVKYASFVTNATVGFEIGQKFAGLKAGDEVIAPAITFCSTINYPLQIGARVVLSDVDPVTLNMDPKDVARKITPKTKVIIPVHLGGYPVDMDPIMKLARERNITVVEDAAHAFGASYKGKMIGTIGDFGSFSLHEVKNVTSMGEGGLLVTNLPCGEDFAKARFVGFDIAHPIQQWLYDVVCLKSKSGEYMVAGNHSTTEIQAVGLIAQLGRMKQVIAARRKAAEYLNARFKAVKGILTPPLDSADIKSAHHLYLLQVDPAQLNGDIQELKKRLQAKGVTQIPHFAPLYRFSYLKQLGYDTEAIAKTCPNSEEAFLHRFTHLPLYPLTKEQLVYMADAVTEAVNEMRR